jgi:hypothetical protein
MAQDTQPRPDPEITYNDPIAYIYYLRSRGLNPMQVDQLVTQRFGPGKTPKDRENDAAKAAEKAGYAQTAGVVGGALLASETARGFPNVKSAFGYETTPTTTLPSQGYNQSGKIGLTRSVPPATTTVDGSGSSVNLGGAATPEVVSSQGSMSTIKTPTGGTQQVPTESLNDSSFWSSVDWGQVAQGGLALAQMYGAYKAYKSGDKAGAGISGAAAAGNLAVATGATSGAYVVPGLNILAGGYQGYQTAEALGDMAAGAKRTRTGVIGGATSGAATGAGIGAFLGPKGAAIGAGIGALVGGTAGGIGAVTGSSKKKPQMTRDAIRKVLTQNNILDEKAQGSLADGTLYDFGKDGSHMKWKNIDKVAEANPNAWSPAVGLTDALATAYGYVGQKASDISAWYAKAAVSNANDNPEVAKANARHFAKQQGITFEGVKQKLDSALKDNRVSQGQYDYYLSNARDLTAGPTQTEKQIVARPAAGKVARVSPGMYMNDKGVIKPSSNVRSALEKFYTEPKGK